MRKHNPLRRENQKIKHQRNKAKRKRPASWVRKAQSDYDKARYYKDLQ